MCFAEIVQKSRVHCAHVAFDKAQMASRLRHVARNRDKRALSDVKVRYVKLAQKLAPEYVKRTVDTSHYKGFPLYMWMENGKCLKGLHLRKGQASA